ncbi:GGDEF domain-containing protein [Thermomonas sp.]
MPIPLSQHVLQALLIILLLPTASLEVRAATDDAQAKAISNCFALRRSEPQAAMVVAESILATPGLAVEPEIKALSCLGVAAGMAGDIARAVESAALVESKVAQHPHLADEFNLRALSNAGTIYHIAGRVHHAAQLYARVSELAKHGSPKDAALTRVVMLTNIGLIHADYLDSAQVADGYYRQALAVAKSIDHEELPLLYNHAVNLVRMGQRDAALTALDAAEGLAVRLDNRLLGQRIRAERAALLIVSGDTARARQLLEAGLAIQQRLPDPPGESDTLAKLSAMHLAVGDAEAALRSAEAAWRKVERGPFMQEQVQALRAMIAAQAGMGQTLAALASAKQLHELQMGALKAQRFEILADLQAKMQDAASRLEVERLRHEGEMQSLSLAKANVLRNSSFAILALLLFAAVFFLLMQRRRNKLLREISATDALTGLTNRRTATHHLNEMAGAAIQMAQGMRHVLFIIDIDHFKKVNDTYGHFAGDGVLVQIARALQAASRPGDIVARWGGEEFLVVCRDLTQEGACAIAERICAAMTQTVEPASGQLLTVTVSLGFAPFPFFSATDQHRDAAAWSYSIRLADRALYAAKTRRNAWAGFWGRQAPVHGTAAEALDDPEKALRSGDIEIMASYPLAQS